MTRKQVYPGSKKVHPPAFGTHTGEVEVMIDEKSIRNRVAELGAEITHDLGKGNFAVSPVMDGGMIFCADLIRKIDLQILLMPLKAGSYGGAKQSSGTVTLHWLIPEGVRGREILIVDDILDTARTLEYLKAQLLAAGAVSVRSCVLLRKQSSKECTADYVGFDIPDQFVVGYGLDLAGKYRNLPFIGIPLSPTPMSQVI